MIVMDKGKVLVGAAAGLLLAGCSSMQGMTEGLRMLNPFGDKITFTEPPKTGELHAFSNVYLNADDQDSPITGAIGKTLSTASAGETPYFNSVISSQFGQSNDQLDEASAAQLKLSIQGERVYEERTVEEHFVCPGDGFVRTCSSEEAHYYKVSCINRTAAVSASLVATSLDGTSHIFSRDSAQKAKSKLCSDEEGLSLKSENELLSDARASVVIELLDGLIPEQRERPSDLVTEINYLNGADAEQLKLAADLAAEGKLPDARQIYLKMSAQHPKNPSLLFNLGLVEQALGNFESAVDYYSRVVPSEEAPVEVMEKYVSEARDWISRGFRTVRKGEPGEVVSLNQSTF